MQKVLTAAQMREVDRRTTEEYGIPSILLMENAAHAVARVVTEKLGGSVKGKSILILCGPGNNGGDGAVLARILSSHGATVHALVWKGWQEAKGDARENFDIASKLPQIFLRSIKTRDELSDHWQSYRAEGHKFGVMVDAVFGTGLTRPLDNDYFSFIDMARDYILDIHRSTVVAVDIPSGLNADGDEPRESPMGADVTVTFTAPKPAAILPPSYRQCGELVIAPIGSYQGLIDESPSKLFLAEKLDAQIWLAKSRFNDTSYKNKRGHALLIAGSKDYSGAAVLPGDAAIRSGVGLVSLAVPESSRESVVARVLPEVMVRGISETRKGSASEKALEEVKEFLKNVDAIAIGSGMSTNDETANFIRRMVEERTMPTVVDADGLTALSPADEMLQKPARKQGRNTEHSNNEAPLILTPHEGEFRKLLGVEKDEADEILKDRVAAVRDFSTKHDVILVLKGDRVLIGVPDGRVIVNPTGNSGLGKAGNGDTLTGILVGFVAQAVQMKIDMVETVVAACYVAGMAGDIAEKKYGKRVMTASDVRECLVEVFASLEAK
jgi:ADP-dependent NAD(P)H-hydrate dehydratase / NAD(P)H-hydrate epimerase